MNFDAITDDALDQLRKVQKKVTNPVVKWKEKPGHRQKNHKVESEDDIFNLYLRQNTSDPQDFSCGLSIIKPDGTPLTLARCIIYCRTIIFQALPARIRIRRRFCKKEGRDARTTGETLVRTAVR